MKNYQMINAFIISFLILFLFNYKVYGDSIELLDNSIIVGKIIEEEDAFYLIANYRGTFKVYKKYIKEVNETKTFQQDIEIQQKLGKKFNPNLIKRNYLAGERIKMLTLRKEKFQAEKEEKQTLYEKIQKKKKRKYSDDWDFGRLHISATYFFTLATQPGKNLEAPERLPAGFSGQLAYEQGLDMLYKKKVKKAKKWIELEEQNKIKKLKKQKKGEKEVEKEIEKEIEEQKLKKIKTRPWFMPGIRIELSYMYFTKELFVNSSREISGFTLTVGPMWAFPSPLNYWGCIVLAGQPGFTFLDIYNRETESQGKSYTFTFTGILGYEYAIKQWVSIALHVRYTFIHDPTVAFHSVGASLGLSIRLW